MDFLNEQDPKQALKQFTNEVFGGKLRWLSSFFAILTLIFLAYLLFFKNDPAVYYPLILKGKVAWVAMWSALIIWGTLAVINWKNWKKNKT